MNHFFPICKRLRTFFLTKITEYIDFNQLTVENSTWVNYNYCFFKKLFNSHIPGEL